MLRGHHNELKLSYESRIVAILEVADAGTAVKEFSAVEVFGTRIPGECFRSALAGAYAMRSRKH